MYSFNTVLKRYTVGFARAKETAQPLATHLGLSVIEIDEALPQKKDILSNHTGQTVLVIGNSDPSLT